MILLVHAEQDENTIADHLGVPEYSYYFVLKAFRRILEQVAVVLPVRDREEIRDGTGELAGFFLPDRVADAVYQICRVQGEACRFMSFSPPHRTPSPLECPTVPVFAWEFYDLPNQAWSKPEQDWRVVLSRSGRAITHSEFACQVVRRAMGDDYPVVSIPAPVWSRFSGLIDPGGVSPDLSPIAFETGVLYDTLPALGPGDSAPGSRAWSARATFDREVKVVAPTQTAPADSTETEWRRVELGGVLYTAILNPNDGRKNWRELVRAFCVALRDRPDATLLLKLVHSSPFPFRRSVAVEVARLRPMRCRVVVLSSFISDADYERLARRTTYAVNASAGEGQCLPLMEFMSCGTPAVAPPHTGMTQYVDRETAFLVASSLEPAAWPHDPRQMIRTFRHRIDIESLMTALRDSYHVAVQRPELYRTMSAAAIRRLEGHCSDRVVQARLEDFLRDWASVPLASKGDPAG